MNKQQLKIEASNISVEGFCEAVCVIYGDSCDKADH